MRLIELILAKNAMEYAVAIISVHDSLKEVLDWRDNGHMSCEEKCAIRQHRTETTHDEEEELNNRQQDSAVDKLVENYSESAVQNRTMLEQQVADAVNISHLYITARQQIALLVTARDAHCNVSL